MTSVKDAHCLHLTLKTSSGIKRQGLTCPSANRLHAFAYLIRRSVTSDSRNNSVCSSLRLEPRNRVRFPALNFLGHDDISRAIFEHFLYHTKCETGNFTPFKMKIINNLLLKSTLSGNVIPHPQ